MNQIILGNKLVIPQVPELIPRLKLIQQLDKASLLPLTVIQAAAGYGKTSLVCDWLQHCPVDCCWLSLDEKDDVPSTFWLYLCASLHGLGEECVQATEDLLRNVYVEDYGLVCDTLVASLNKLTRKWDRPSRCVLVLDDFHVINHPQVLTSFSRFLDYKPYWLQVIITSRTLPQLGMPQRLSKQKAGLIEANQLAFDQEDSIRLLSHRASHSVSPEQSRKIYKLSRGWPAAIQLMALTLETSGRLPDYIGNAHNDLMSNFLFEEVYLQLDQGLQDLLQSLCVIQRFNVSLINLFNENREGEVWLKKLMSSGLFITQTVENNAAYYKIHDLFRNWLLDYGAQHQPKKILSDRKIAIQWFVEQQQYEDALYLAFDMDDWCEAALMMRHLFQGFLHNGHLDYLQKLIHRFPVNEVIQRPHLSLLQSLLSFYQYQHDQMRTFLKYTCSSLEQLNQSLSTDDKNKEYILRSFGLFDLEDIDLIYSAHAVIESMMARFNGDEAALKKNNKIIEKAVSDTHPLACWAMYGRFADAFIADDVARSLTLGKQALQKAKEVEDAMCTVITLSWYIHALIHHGQVPYALKLAEDHLEWIERMGLSSLPNIPSFYCALCHLYIETLQLEKAQKCFHDLENTIHDYTEPREILFCKYYLKYKLLMALGLVEKASEWIEEIKAYQQSHLGYLGQLKDFSVVPRIEVFDYLSQLRQGNVMPLFQWATTGLEDDVTLMRYETERFIQLVGLTLMGQDTLDELDDIMSRAQQRGVYSRWISIWLFKIQYLNRTGEEQTAFHQLTKLLTIAKEKGFAQLILDGGAEVPQLLKTAMQADVEREYCELLLKTSMHPMETLHNDIQQNKPASCEGLSGSNDLNMLTHRELQVLEQLAMGLRNQTIAEELGVSLATVKRHIQNIYGKLQVNSRTEAALIYNRTITFPLETV